ncbi:MAG: adenosylmethionine--8-amino-7-oxononanoate transaminase [Alphaproteobacteria bacterium]|nr:adenosylmethionine--8-amino-7-oxononanoate transaminase [Alphaproteobacteria bacterium]
MSNTRSPLWHPFTQHALADAEILIEKAQGSLLYTHDGRTIIDGISSWWVNTHGHCHPALVKAVQEQAAQLDQVIFAGFTHAPAEKLALELLKFTPSGLSHLFLSDSGSTAVEAALKMAIGYHAHRGKPRHTIVALEHGYHGDTFGAMAAGAPSIFNDIYAPFLFKVERLPFPEKNAEEKTITAFKNLLEKNAHDIAALILEPLILGAGGMRIYSPSVLKQLSDLCKTHGIILIADEVMTGFGRTGTRFACDQAGIMPDIMCLSKGITGGILPLGATLCSSAIYDAFYVKDKAKTFWHSSSYTGNALACAAALANLNLWQENDTDAQIKNLTARQAAQLKRLENHPFIANPRQCGTIIAFEICHKEKGYLSSIASALYSFFLNHDILLRPLGDTVYVLPPYCISDEELARITTTIIKALDAIGSGALKSAA